MYGVMGENGIVAVTFTAAPDDGELGEIIISNWAKSVVLSEVWFFISVIKESEFRGWMLTTASLAP